MTASTRHRGVSGAVPTWRRTACPSRSRLDAGSHPTKLVKANGHAAGPEGGTNGKTSRLANARAMRIAALRAEFDQWWESYPEQLDTTPRDRELAFKKFRAKRTEGVPFDKLVKAARNYDIEQRSNPNPDAMFIKAPWRWLDEDRYEDEFATRH
jgi:hypothetical protein